MDWNKHKYGPGIECRFTPRESYCGREVRPDVLEYDGDTDNLVALWLMGSSDPYPGEWALGKADCSEVFGSTWVASGDVTPVRKITGHQNLDTKIDTLLTELNEIAELVNNYEFGLPLHSDDAKTKMHSAIKKLIVENSSDNRVVVSKYNELLMAVGKKWPGEDRHATALRYIRSAEDNSGDGKTSLNEKVE